MPSLMDLALETRIIILNYAIPDRVILEVTPTCSSIWAHRVAAERLPFNPALPLLLTNSVIRAEVALCPKPLLVAYFGHTCRYDHLRDWIRQTTASYRAHISELEISFRKYHGISDHCSLERYVGDADNEDTARHWEKVHRVQIELGFRNVECAHSKRSGKIVNNRRLGLDNSAYIEEEYRFVVSGAKAF